MIHLSTVQRLSKQETNVYDGGQKDHKTHIMVTKVIASTDVKPTQITRCLRINPIPKIRLSTLAFISLS